ncbi:MAG: hypothetical protein OXU45_03840 [Candidatus Melainabacteria bacterium]|nr:hypothetical protein [Candidatus Melainabacteria bacterium]
MTEANIKFETVKPLDQFGQGSRKYFMPATSTGVCEPAATLNELYLDSRSQDDKARTIKLADPEQTEVSAAKFWKIYLGIISKPGIMANKNGQLDKLANAIHIGKFVLQNEGDTEDEILTLFDKADLDFNEGDRDHYSSYTISAEARAILSSIIKNFGIGISAKPLELIHHASDKDRDMGSLLAQATKAKLVA